MATFDDIGSGLGLAELEVSKAVGVIMGFQHRAQLPVPIHCEILTVNSENEEIQAGRRTVHHRMDLVIPVQAPAWSGSGSGSSGFSGAYSVPTYASNPDGILEGDRFEYPLGSSGYYYVRGVIQMDANGYIWKVPVESEKTTSLGNRS